MVAALTAVPAFAQSGGGYVILKSTVDGGGVTFHTGGGYRLGGTVGQHDAGDPTGGEYVLTGGFWSPAVGGLDAGVIEWDAGDTSPDRTTRSLRFRVDSAAATASGVAGENAIKVELVELGHPNPRNAHGGGVFLPGDYFKFDTNMNGVCAGAVQSPNYNGYPCNPPFPCPCNADVAPPFGGPTQQPDTLDLLAVVNCVNNGICNCTPSCDINCDGTVDINDINAAVCRVQLRPPEVCCAVFGDCADGDAGHSGTSCSNLAACTAAGESVPPNASGQGGCARWVGRPGTFYEAQDDQDLGSYRAARLQCTPFYFDWVTETAGNVCAAPFLGPTNTGLPCATDADCGGRVCVLSTNHGDPCTADAQCPGGTCPPTCIPKKITVVGAEILPSSTYSVQTYGSSCKKSGEAGCSDVSSPARPATHSPPTLRLLKLRT